MLFYPILFQPNRGVYREDHGPKLDAGRTILLEHGTVIVAGEIHGFGRAIAHVCSRFRARVRAWNDVSEAGSVNLTGELCHALGSWHAMGNSTASGFVPSNSTVERQWATCGQDAQEKVLESIVMGWLGVTEGSATNLDFFTSGLACRVNDPVLSAEGDK
jgi:hypothetical protein